MLAVSGLDDPRYAYGRYAKLRRQLNGDEPDDSTEDGRKKAIDHLIALKAKMRARYPLN